MFSRHFLNNDDKIYNAHIIIRTTILSLILY